jgi:HAD superfamily hydrolase (TIGR01509 family)
VNTKPQAFLFDLNGTMINDMGYHWEVWSDILINDLGATISRDEVKKNMYGKNDDMLFRVFGKDKFTPEKRAEISIEKERRYQKIYKPHLDLIPGLFDFMNLAKAHQIKMAIGSAAILFNIDFVLDNLNIRHYFNAIVSADDVTDSKPHPETFLKDAELIGVTPSACVVFEDAPKGVESAMNAGMNCVVLTTMHDEYEFKQYPNVIMFIKDYTDPRLNTLFM